MTEDQKLVERLETDAKAAMGLADRIGNGREIDPGAADSIITALANASRAAADRIRALEGENARLKPVPSKFEDMFSVVYRTGELTAEDYDEAIEALQNAKMALVEGDSMGCRVCEDSGHGAGECHHNPLLLARQWASASRFWQCWHCGFVATNDAEGREHFGEHDGELPSCIRTELEARAERLQAQVEELREGLKLSAADFEKLLREWMYAPFPREAQILGQMSPPTGPFAEAAESIRRTLALLSKQEKEG